MIETSLAQIGYENYYQMLSDKVRMDAYRQAIFKIVKTGDIVVDMGAGTGLLGIWAIQAGAKKVYAIEKTEAIHLARSIAEANKCSDKIEFINENSMDAVLPERADVLLSETLGSFGIDENTILFTNDARNRFLKEDGLIIPQSLKLYVAPVEDKKTYEKLDFWRNIPDIDFTPAFDLFSRKIMVEFINKNGLLSASTQIADFDFTQNISDKFNARNYIKIIKTGTIHGVAGWFKVELCEGVEIDTAPSCPQTHWKQAFFPFKNSIDVINGDVLDWSVNVQEKLENSDDTQISYEYRCTQLKNEIALPKNIGRNDKCPCGSGLKFKKCCMS